MKKSNNKNGKNGVENGNKRSDSNIFYMMDGIIDQLNRTKRLFIIMILTIMIIPPIVFVLSFILLGFPFHNDNDDSNLTYNKPWGNDSSSSSNFNPSFRYLPLIPVIVVIVWLGIGIRQWIVLSKWDKKYKKYKELQKKIDEELEKADKDETR